MSDDIPRELKAEGWLPLPDDPKPYELVQLLYKDGRKKMAWWANNHWDSGRELPSSDPIAYRKREQITTIWK